MTLIGDPGLWSDTFPAELVPRILDLVSDSWEGFEKPVLRSPNFMSSVPKIPGLRLH